MGIPRVPACAGNRTPDSHFGNSCGDVWYTSAGKDCVSCIL